MKKFIYLIVIVALVVAVTPGKAQKLTMYSEYSLESDTVTNAGTSYLGNTTAVKCNGPVTVHVVATKISGTVGGTITLQGGFDATNVKALVTEETQTALATITASDGSTNYHWRLKNNPFSHYRVSWTGTGTMSASFTAKLVCRD